MKIHDKMPSKQEKRISVVIPAYNERENIEETIKSCVQYLDRLTDDYEIVVVDDGSRDGTGEILDRLAQKNNNIKAFHHMTNRGIGAALKTGYSNAEKEFVFYIPADGQIRIEELGNYLKHTDNADVVVGYHLKRADTFKRKLKSGIYHLILRIFFGLNFRLTTTSKLYRKEVLKSINFEADSAFIEPEILYKAKRKGFRFAEVPIHHHPRSAGKPKGDSKRETIKTLSDLFRLWLLIRFKIRI